MPRLPNDSELVEGSHKRYNTSSPQDYFATTQWTLIIHAGNSQASHAGIALNELCSRYWFPLYVYARHRGSARADAEDLVQGFFSHFLEKNYLQGVKSEKGRFRAFLLACFKNHSLNEWKKAGRLKRGGGADHLPIEWANADEKFRSQLMIAETPERGFDRAWAVTLLEQVLAQLGQQMETEGKGELFEVLMPGLTVNGDDFSHQASANGLKMSEEASRAAAMRLRKRYRDLLRHEILKTCEPAEVEQEIRYLLDAFSD